MRPVFGGSTKIVLASEKSTGNKDLPLVFVYAAHLPIKMQMRNGLQMRLGKQMNGGKKQKGIKKEDTSEIQRSLLSRKRTVYIDFHFRLT